MDNQELLTVSELSRLLKVHPCWIYAKTRSKGPDAIPRIRLGKYLRFPRAEVMQWVRERASTRGGTGHE